MMANIDDWQLNCQIYLCLEAYDSYPFTFQLQHICGSVSGKRYALDCIICNIVVTDATASNGDIASLITMIRYIMYSGYIRAKVAMRVTFCFIHYWSIYSDIENKLHESNT